jgi:ethanolamine ammonia-lyase small subunit
MTVPGPPLRSPRDLRQLTPARVGLGRVGASLPTQALLEFTLDHARARDAVRGNFNVAAIVSGLQGLGLKTLAVSSRVRDREDYLRRPDLGRKLDDSSRDMLVAHGGDACDCAIVIADGLSPSAVASHAIDLVRSLLPRFAAAGMAVEIGALVGARTMAMLIGERPGLSVPGSLGAYLTFAPKPGLTDANRNCVSNIHPAGLATDEAAFKIAWLVREGLARRISGVALKDESSVQHPLRVAGDGRGTTMQE